MVHNAKPLSRGVELCPSQASQVAADQEPLLSKRLACWKPFWLTRGDPSWTFHPPFRYQSHKCLGRFNVEPDQYPFQTASCMLGKRIFFNPFQIRALSKTDILEHMQSQFVAVPLNKFHRIVVWNQHWKNSSQGFTLGSRSVHGHSCPLASHSLSLGGPFTLGSRSVHATNFRSLTAKNSLFPHETIRWCSWRWTTNWTFGR